MSQFVDTAGPICHDRCRRKELARRKRNDTHRPESHGLRWRLARWILAYVGGLALGAAVLAWLDSRNYESPHFAQVQGRVDLIGARVSGTIAGEGDTLVVDTTNFTDKAGFRGSTPDLHVIERFTRAGDHALLYRFTIDDPNTWTKPWTGEYSWAKANGPIYEYACHEGNYALMDIMKGARLREKEETAKTGAK